MAALSLEEKNKMWTLLHLRYKHVFAEHGENGSNHCYGKNGKNNYIDVPLGTIVKDESEKVICEVTHDGEEFTIVKGGMGGRGNSHFKSSTNQSPRYAQSGEEFKEGWYVMELKVLADVGLVGFPNAGKSTLLSVLTQQSRKLQIIPLLL